MSAAVITAIRKKYPETITETSAAGVQLHAACGISTSSVNSVVGGGRYALEDWVDAQLESPAYDWVAGDLALRTEAGGFEDRWSFMFGLFFHRVQSEVNTDSMVRLKAMWCMVKLFPIDFSKAWGPVGWFSSVEPHLFSTFREILEGASMNPSMARWLTFLGNQKETATTQPDENFAREIMQLFSIGLWELHPNGERVKNGELPENDPRYVLNGTDDVPTYTQEDVRGLARVFTGWFNSAGTTEFANSGDPLLDQPLSINAALHEDGEKSFLGITIPANTNATDSLALALDRIVTHPSCAPFICKRLIQSMTTSNPSPEYIARVVAAFRSNPMGNMKATWKAILLDQEALDPTRAQKETWGKIREPWMVVSQMVAGFPSNSLTPGRVLARWVFPLKNNVPNHAGGLQGLTPPSVFGLFPYDYSAVPTLREEGINTPELAVYGDVGLVALSEALDDGIDDNIWGFSGDNRSNAMDMSELVNLPTIQDVADRLNILLCAGQLSQEAMDYVMTRMPLSIGAGASRLKQLEFIMRFMLFDVEGLVVK